MSVYVNSDIADGGSSDPNAAKKAELQRQIDYYNGIKNQLDVCKKAISDADNTIGTDVYDKIAEPYNLSGDDLDWQGKNYDDALSQVTTLEVSVGAYRGEVSTLLSDIQRAIDKLGEKITELTNEYNSL
ncbi:MAG: hypothetical protein E7307_06460 [Butyrivibrio sp.]|nr:hypothetical protein [Butyrivibrio sp.]